MKYKKWLSKNTNSLFGKTVAITGTTGGIGIELCRYILYLGATLIMIDRNSKKSNKTKEILLSEFPDRKIKQYIADMSDLTTVKILCDNLKSDNIDYLLLNAGAYCIPRKITDIGYDNIFQINFISPYYIVKELLPQLSRNNGMVIAVSSIAHNYSKTEERDVDFRNKKHCNLVYGNSKRYLTFALFELFKDKKDVSLSITHPGITFTNITAHYPKWLFFIIKNPMKFIFMKPNKAALSIIYGLFNSSGYHQWIGPRIFNIWGYPHIKKLKTCDNSESLKIYNNAEQIIENIINC